MMRVQYLNIKMVDVKNPIVINQNYCDKEKKSSCRYNQHNAVSITNVTFDNIIGTYTRRSIDMECSDSKPCTDLRLNSVQLKPSPTSSNENYPPLCYNSFGITCGSLFPSSLSSCLATKKLIF